jgi:hypothetical protein
MKLLIIVICPFCLGRGIDRCASTTVTGQRQYVTEAVPRPGQIWVYDFVATASDIPVDPSEVALDQSATQTTGSSASGDNETVAQLALARQTAASVCR